MLDQIFLLLFDNTPILPQDRQTDAAHLAICRENDRRQAKPRGSKRRASARTHRWSMICMTVEVVQQFACCAPCDQSVLRLGDFLCSFSPMLCPCRESIFGPDKVRGVGERLLWKRSRVCLEAWSRRLKVEVIRDSKYCCHRCSASAG